jgi:hypothetical protein
MQQAITASTSIEVAYRRARHVLVSDPGAVFMEDHATSERHHRRYRSHLSVTFGGGARVQQDVAFQLGDAESSERGLVLPMTWRATGRARLLPTFTGELHVTEAASGTALRLCGDYTVPLGVLGRIVNRMAGRRLARRSLGELVDRLAWQLSAEAERSVGWAEPAHSSDLDALREQPRSEIYIG